MVLKPLSESNMRLQQFKLDTLRDSLPKLKSFSVKKKVLSLLLSLFSKEELSGERQSGKNTRTQLKFWMYFRAAGGLWILSHRLHWKHFRKVHFTCWHKQKDSTERGKLVQMYPREPEYCFKTIWKLHPKTRSMLNVILCFTHCVRSENYIIT